MESEGQGLTVCSRRSSVCLSVVACVRLTGSFSGSASVGEDSHRLSSSCCATVYYVFFRTLPLSSNDKPATLEVPIVHAVSDGSIYEARQTR